MEITLSNDLETLVKKNASDQNLSTTEYIENILSKLFEKELDEIKESYSELYKGLKKAVIEYAKSLPSGSKFTILDIPYYQNLKESKLRLMSDFSAEMQFEKSPELNDIDVSITDDGKVEYRGEEKYKYTAVYIKK